MIRIVVSNPEKGNAYQIEPEESQSKNLIGLKIGDKFKGEKIGLSGYELKITGGSDEEGFSMRADVRGSGRTRAFLSKGPGYKPKKNGERRRKTVRGKIVSDSTIQLNTKIVGWGDKPLEELIGLEPIEGEEKEEEPEEGSGEAEEKDSRETGQNAEEEKSESPE